MNNWPKVSIIVLNWNGWRDTIECLESLRRITYPNYQIIVVDNSSTDGSVEKIKAWTRGEISIESKFFSFLEPKLITLIEYTRTQAERGGDNALEERIEKVASRQKLVLIHSDENLGFAAGNNVAIRYALRRGYPHIGLLNNDTVVEPNYLTLLVSTLGEESQWIACAPKILLKESPTRIWYAGAKIRMYKGGGLHIGLGEQDGPEFKGIKATACFSGCAFIARRILFEKVGLLDEDFFLAHEDVDLSYRAGQQELLFCVNLDSKIYHKAGGAIGQKSPQAFYFDHKGRMIFIAKNSRLSQKIGFWTFWSLTRLISFTLLILQGRQNLVVAQLRAMHDFLTKRWGEYDRKRMNSDG